MISAFTPPGIKVAALRSGHGIVAGQMYTVRGFVINRHWRTREPDPHVLLTEYQHRRGRISEIGLPRDAFTIPDFAPSVHQIREDVFA